MSVAGRAVLALCAALTALPAFAQRPPSAARVPERTFGTMSNATLLAVPFFIMAGNLMNSAGITDRIFHFAIAAVGWA